MAFVLCSLAAEATPFFVVIASFTEQGDARRLAQSVQTQYKEASFMYEEERELYHVYVGQTDSHAKAEELRASLRLQAGFANAWIYTDLPSFRLAREIIKSTPEQYARLNLAGSSSASASHANHPRLAGTSPLRTVTFAFKARTPAGVNIPGKVILLGRDGNAIIAFKTGNSVQLNWQGGQKLILSCQVKGYGPEIAFIDLGDIRSAENIHRTDDGTLEVTFTLGKVDPNTVRLVYRDIFHKDASVLLPDTREKLDLLSGMITRNPYLNVEINAHCQEAGRRSLRLAADDDYFNFSGAVPRTGNERFLSSERAKTVRNYLVANGAHNRISAMGWGDIAPLLPSETSGRKPAADSAGLSERVEVELRTVD